MDGHAASMVVFGLPPLLVAGVIFLLTYLAILVERVNRAVVALLGAGAMVASGVITSHQAFDGVDLNTLFLLIGMMVIVGVSRQSGLFQAVAIVAARASRGSPSLVMALLALVTAVLSALLDNVTTVLLITPVTILIARDLKQSPYPFLVSLIFASNLGGTATLIGDPPNILIGSAVGLSFLDFLTHTGPVAGVALLVQMGMFHLLFGRKMKASDADRARVMGLDPWAAVTDPWLMGQSLFVLGLVITAFVLQRPLHLEPGAIALTGAAVMLLLNNLGHAVDHQHHRVTAAFNEVEWITIFFFVGLFMVVTGVEHAGLMKVLADALLDATGGDLPTTAYAILWASAVFSAIVDNIPFVATMIPLIENLAPQMGGEEAIMPLWWALALGACFGGNGTLVGASANLTVAGLAAKEGVEFRFLRFTLLAFPMMLVSIVIAHVYMWLRYF